MDNGITCKYCGSEGVVKYGTYNGVQRYFCKVCQRKFKADDTTFHMKTDVNQVSSALNMHYEGMSIKAIRRHLQQEFNNSPSTATIYEWIMKYTQYATDSIKGYHPEVGNIWIADETVLKIDGKNVWFWDIIDDKTRYLLASRISHSRTTRDAKELMEKAAKVAGKSPKVVITDKLQAYLDGIELAFGADTEHKQSRPFALTDNTQKIERFHGTLKQRTKVMRGLKNIETAIEFTNGWLVHYNYLRPHEALKDKTPAEVAGVKYPYRNWQDIIRKHQPATKITIEHQPRYTIQFVPDTQISKSRRHKLPDTSLRRPRRRAGIKERQSSLAPDIVYSRGRRHIRLY
ncbi:transposase [Chloroflexota bacterium]